MGVVPWTAQCIAMRARLEPDSLPASGAHDRQRRWAAADREPLWHGRDVRAALHVWAEDEDKVIQRP